MNIHEKDTPEPAGEEKRGGRFSSIFRKVVGRAGKEEELPQEDDSAEKDQKSDIPPPPEKSQAPQWLLRYRHIWLKESGRTRQGGDLLEDFIADSVSDHTVLENLFRSLDKKAEERLTVYERAKKEQEEKKRKAEEEALRAMEQAAMAQEDGQTEEPQPPETEEEEPPFMDACMEILLSPDSLTAWCMAFPPLGSGKELDIEILAAGLKEAGIIYGLHEETIERLGSGNDYLRLAAVASGDPPVNGEDGWVTEHFPRTAGVPQLMPDDYDNIDFKTLNWLIPVEEGQLICDVVWPTDGTPGADVMGREVNPKRGKKAVLPMGDNLCLNEEKTAIISKVSGQITFRNQKFNVAEMIVVPGNVDLTTGNMDVKGNLLVQGNVLSGFTLRATGDITVQGIVEGSQIAAGGNIVIEKGMNGNLVGTLDAGKEIHCKYLENASARADGDVNMCSIINSTVVSNGKIVARSGHGAIIGGTVSAMQGIDARSIGNKVGRTTVLMLGANAQFLSKKSELEKEYHDVTAEIKSLEQKAGGGQPRLNLAILKLKESQLKQKLELLRERETAVEDSEITADIVYPIAQISIKGQLKTVLHTTSLCRFYLDGGEVQVLQK